MLTARVQDSEGCTLSVDGGQNPFSFRVQFSLPHAAMPGIAIHMFVLVRPAAKLLFAWSKTLFHRYRNRNEMM
jgi:hypothetical protein